MLSVYALSSVFIARHRIEESALKVPASQISQNLELRLPSQQIYTLTIIHTNSTATDRAPSYAGNTDRCEWTAEPGLG
jgi:hypothetical protein